MLTCSTSFRNQERHFIKIPFINKGMEFIGLPSIFKVKSVNSAIAAYLKNTEAPIMCYKYNTSIWSTICNFNKLVSDLDIDANTRIQIRETVRNPSSLILQLVMFIGNLKIISDSRIHSLICKGPKYRFPSRIDFKMCREEVAAALNDFGNRW